MIKLAPTLAAQSVVIRAPLIDLGLFACQTLDANPNNVIITFQSIPYSIKIEGNTQGFHPVLFDGCADMFKQKTNLRLFALPIENWP